MCVHVVFRVVGKWCLPCLLPFDSSQSEVLTACLLASFLSLFFLRREARVCCFLLSLLYLFFLFSFFTLHTSHFTLRSFPSFPFPSSPFSFLLRLITSFTSHLYSPTTTITTTTTIDSNTMDESESTAPQQAIVLTIRPSSGSTFTTAISTDSTVLQLKEKLATADLPATSIRLVYSGRVLKDDDQLSVYSIMEGHTLHMVKCASNRANEQAVQTVRPNANSNAGGADGFDEQVCPLHTMTWCWPSFLYMS
ncbi:MAG: ubiquitin-related domain-containing protein [Linnemannia gamsii]|nr:MAG: ubiquitin-related domain-containing protein [Linnemannia gamsii]